MLLFIWHGPYWFIFMHHNNTMCKPVRSTASIKRKLWAPVLTIYALLMQLTVQVYTSCMKCLEVSIVQLGMMTLTYVWLLMICAVVLTFKWSSQIDIGINCVSFITINIAIFMPQEMFISVAYSFCRLSP